MFASFSISNRHPWENEVSQKESTPIILEVLNHHNLSLRALFNLYMQKKEASLLRQTSLHSASQLLSITRTELASKFKALATNSVI